MRTWSALLLLLAACKGPDPYVPVDTDDDTDIVDTDPVDTDEDTDIPGTDMDGDGWDVEDGDCDDNDVWINPAWPEKEDDDKDNDCDGLVDEVFVGVRVLDINTKGGPPRMHEIDRFGDLDDTLTFSGAVYADWMADDPDGDGWWFADGNQAALFHVSSAGVSTEIWTDAETEYEEGEGPLGYFGLDRHPDGYWLMSGANRLWKITDEGVATVVAEWDCLTGEEEITVICPLDVTVDRFTGDVGLFGAFGGFALWTEAGGLDVQIYDDVELGLHSFTHAGKKDNGNWFALGTDATTGALGLYKYKMGDAAISLKGDWPNDDYQPVDFVIEQETGDIYFTANGGWYYTIWRMVADGTYTAQLFTTDASDPDRMFAAIGIIQTHD